MADGVGNRLREARGRRKLSLREVEEATKIRGRYLQAIEDEDWGQLPGDTYARAFIRTYAAVVGLEGDRLAEEQRQARGAARPGERLPRVDPRPRPVAGVGRRRPIQSRLLMVVVLALVVAALFAVGLLSGGGRDDPTGQSQHHAPAPHVSQAVPVR